MSILFVTITIYINGTNKKQREMKVMEKMEMVMITVMSDEKFYKKSFVILNFFFQALRNLQYSQFLLLERSIWKKNFTFYLDKMVRDNH